MRTVRFARRIYSVLADASQADVSPTVMQQVIDMTDVSVATAAADRNVDLSKVDLALPQTWFEAAMTLSGTHPSGHVVWSYEYDSIMGVPQALTPEGDLIVALMCLGSPRTNEIHDDNRAELQSLIGNALRTMRQED